MKKWRACSTYYGPEASKYTLFEFDIPDELYDQLMKAVDERISINSLDCYSELNSLANEAHDKLNVLEYWEDEPEREDYDNEEDYLDAMEEYREERDSYIEEWTLEDFEIEDPGDKLRILDEYKGRQVADEQDDEETTLYEELEQGEFGENTCYLEYTVDKNGCLIDFEARAEGLESEDFRRSTKADCLPNYFMIEELFSELCKEYE